MIHIWQNYILDFEFRSFSGPEICNPMCSGDAGHLPVIHAITPVNTCYSMATEPALGGKED